MMTALATVTSVEQTQSGYRVLLSCEQQTSCSSCSSQKSCGTGIVSKAVGNKSLQWNLTSDKPVSEGQVVEIGFPERNLLQSAATVYIIPLIMMLVGALLGQWWIAPWLGGGEGSVILLSMLFIALGVMISKRVAHTLEAKDSHHVTLIRVFGNPIS